MPFVKRVNAKNLPIIADTRKIFIGRTDELHFFAEHILQPEDPSYNIVSISGEGGVGKSTLLARFIDEVKSPPFKDYCLTAFVDEQQTTPYSVMEKFAAQLSESGTPLIEFEKGLSRYKETVRKLQIEQETTQDTAVRETVDLVGTVAEEVPIVGGVIHKGANIVTELYLQDRRTRQMLKDAELLEDPLGDLTKVFVEELNRLTDKQFTLGPNKTKRNQRIILFIDTFEQLANEIAPWLLDNLLQANISSNVVLVVAGRDSIEYSTPHDPKRWLPYRDNGIIYLINLNNFTEEETSVYLAERGITDPAYIATIWHLSKGLPLYLGLLTFNLQGNVDPTADVVANFLRWIPEHENIKRKLALDAALFSRPFNQDDLSAFAYVKQEDKDALYRWLTRLPFVRTNPQDGRHRYHDLAQDMFRRDLYQRSRKEYYTTRHELAFHYRQLLEQVRKIGGKEKPVSFENIELVLALAYQLFYLSDEISHIDAVEQIINIFAHTNAEQDKEISRFLRDLSHERDTSNMNGFDMQTATHLLRFIEADTEDQSQNLFDTASVLLKKVAQHTTFSSHLLAWIYDKRGDASNNLKEYQRAIQDYDRAIELEPTAAIYYTDRGIVYTKLKEYQRAIQDYDRAIELDLNYAKAHNQRGNTYYKLKEYQRAIQDYDRAIELESTAAIFYANRGSAYSNLKEYQRAIQDYDRAIELEPTKVANYTNRGFIYYKLKEHQRAIQDYDRAIESDPNYASGYNQRGNVYLGLKEYQQAIQDYDRAIELEPSLPVFYLNRGFTYYELKEYQRAIQDYDRAIELESASPVFYINRSNAYRELKEYQRAIQDCDQAIELDSNYASAYNRRGNLYLDMKEYQRAIQDYDRAIELEPTSAVYHTNRGNVYYILKEYQCAIQDHDQAIELDLNYARAHNRRGNIYYELKEYQRAIQDYDRAIELESTATVYYLNRGFIYYKLKEYQCAIQDCNRVIELDPNYASAYNQRGNVYYELKEYQQAIQDYDRAIKLEPTSVTYYTNRGNTYRELKAFQRAIQDYDQAIKLEPTYARAYNHRGWTKDDLKEHQQAIQDFDRAIELDPKNASYYNNRGFAYSNLKEYQRAIQDYDQAIKLDPNDLTQYTNRGNAYRELKDYQRAIQDYDQAIEKDQNYVKAYRNRGLAYLWLRDINRARDDFSRSQELDPTTVHRGWMTEWVKICQEGTNADTSDRLEAIAKLEPQDYEAFICRGVALWLRKYFEEAHREITQAITIEPESWDAYFWQGLTYASLEKNSEAMISIEKALAVGLPPVLLTPLRLLEQTKPDFYIWLFKPFFEKYNL